MNPDVVVVGGGISGMVAAHRLAGSGARVTLVEKSKRLGGIVETSHQDGFVIEGGPDSFVAAKGAVLRLAAELGLEDEVIHSRPTSHGSSVWWEGALHPLPGGLLLMVPFRFGPLFGSSLLTWSGKVRVLADLVLPRSRDNGDESLESFVRRRLGVEVLERIAEPLVAGIHAAEPGTMSLRASFPRFLDMEQRHRSLIVAARKAASGSPGSTGHFASFREGMGQLTSALYGALEGDRVALRTGAEVVGIEAEGTSHRLTLDDGSVLGTDRLVLAIPAPLAARLVVGVSPEASSALRSIEQVANAAVTLAYDTESLPALTGSGFVVPSAQARRVRGVSYLSRKWDGRVPDPGYTLLRVFVGSLEAATLSPPDLIRLAREELEAMVGIAARPIRSWARIHPQGLHRYTVGHVERVAAAQRVLTARSGLVLAGAGFHGVGLNECVESGWRAADTLISASHDHTISSNLGDSR